MHVLQINKFYHIEGGADRYFLDLSALLTQKGHQLAVYSTKDHRNLLTHWDKYFPHQINLNQFSLQNAVNFIYNREARKRIANLLDDFPCEIAHLHNIYHHLTPSILPELKQRNIPIVMTVSDYHLISPNYFMFHRGKICEITKLNKYNRALLHKCVKGSYLKSLLEITEKYLYLILGWERNYIDHFLAPSDFMRSKMIEYGIPEKKVTTLPHFIDSGKYKPNYNPEKYILYFGRLSEEKGLMVLLRTMKQLPKIKLVIAGAEPEEKELRKMNKELGNRNVEFVGFKSGRELYNLIANCRFTVLSSVWYEVFGLSILESFACGKPVIASNIGGIPEIVRNGYNGYLVEPGNINDMVKEIRYLWGNINLCNKMGKYARDCVKEKYGPDKHYEQMIKIYQKAIKTRSYTRI